ncbi:MAG: SHOCT domain-containing protein [Burkholderiales bacterium]
MIHFRRHLPALILGCAAIAPAAGAAETHAEQLRALDIAYRNGILTQQEYEAKKRALTAPPARQAPAGAPAPTAAEGPRPGGTTSYQRMKLVRVMDNEGWGQPVEALRMLVPADWRADGGVRWTQGQFGCPPNIVQIQWRAVSPDGSTGIELLPQLTWQWTDDPQMQQIIRQQAANQTGCPLIPTLGAADFVRQLVVPQVRQGAQVLGTEPLPGATRTETRNAEAGNQALLQAGYLRGIRADVSRVRLAWQDNGRPVEEWIQATVLTKATPAADTAALMQGQMNYNSNTYSVTAYNVFGIRAARGQLDARAPLFATVLASVRVNPQFQAALGQFLLSMAKINSRGAMDRHRIWQEAQRATAETWQQTVQQREESQARIHEQFGQTIRGVETFVDPRSNERVELSSSYRNAWSNGKGEYLLSDSPNFDPRVTLQEDWTLMRRETER